MVCSQSYLVVPDALLALSALSVPSATGYGFLFDPYLQLLLSVSLIFGSLLVSATNPAGPLRYAYYHHQDLTEKVFPFASHIGTRMMGWASLPVLTLALLPWFRTGFFMCIVPAAWQFVLEEHRRNINQLSNDIDECCSNAQAAVDKALSDADKAREHMHRLDQNLRADDLYGGCSAAYLVRVKLSTSDSDTGSGPTTRSVQGATLSRGVETTTTAAEVVAENAVEASNAAQKSLQLLHEIQHAAVQVKTAAGEGRMEGLEDQVKATQAKLEAAIRASGGAETAEKKARDNARNTHLGWLLVREQHAEEVARVTSTVDKACIQAAALSGQARAELGAAERLENTAHMLVANVVRDARAAHDVWLDSAWSLGEVKHFQLASDNARKGREIQTEAANGAVVALEKIEADVVAAAEAARKAAEHASRVRQSAVGAKAAAALGGVKGAEPAIRELNEALQACQQQFEQAVDKREDVQATMVQFARDTHLPDP
ncbi:hypothetical protein B0I35DRAFT_481391 [Stachybotrys elegans]|uniref:Uncharacterized protein n=1 Tax=Stachybotrys elegans TaxID=80388 RepID=A0A8K0SPE4_9HYPO|nr:hypothetical protein B0I35DRAFT_481391 [Stachybotrys elegans]